MELPWVTRWITGRGRRWETQPLLRDQLLCAAPASREGSRSCSGSSTGQEARCLYSSAPSSAGPLSGDGLPHQGRDGAAGTLRSRTPPQPAPCRRSATTALSCPHALGAPCLCVPFCRGGMGAPGKGRRRPGCCPAEAPLPGSASRWLPSAAAAAAAAAGGVMAREGPPAKLESGPGDG